MSACDCLQVTLELGGKSPLIIYDDCDMEQAIATADVGLFANGGQCCVASSRIFVQVGVSPPRLALGIQANPCQTRQMYSVGRLLYNLCQRHRFSALLVTRPILPG